MSGRDGQGSSGGSRGFGGADKSAVESLKALWRRLLQTLRGKKA